MAVSCQQNLKETEETTEQEEVSDYNKPELRFEEKLIGNKKKDTLAVNPEPDPPIESRNLTGEETSPEEIEAKREARQYFNVGVRKLKQKQYQESVIEFDKSLALDGENSRAYYNRGLAHYRMDMYNEAKLDFDNSIRLNPNDSSSNLYLGMMKYFKNDFIGAIEEYNKTLAIAPYYPNAYYNRGLAKGRLSDFDNAIADFNTAIGLNPYNEDFYFNRGLALFLSGDTIQACRNWTDARDLGSSQAIDALRYYCEEK